MTTLLTPETIRRISAQLRPSLASFAKRYPGESGSRQPVHTVYGGAHLFKADTAVRLGQLAMRSFESFAPDSATFGAALDIRDDIRDAVFLRVHEKLTREAVEDALPLFAKTYSIDKNWRQLPARLVKAELLPDDPAILKQIESGKAAKKR